jgi:peptide/nickel transport system ATP-binding protein
VQRQILDTLRELQQRLGLSVILVTHDISVVAYICDRTVVMYAGKVAESGSMNAALTAPSHPYTMGLRNAFPDLQGAASGVLTPIEGAPPNLANPPAGCRFKPRCPFALDLCGDEPPVIDVAPGHPVLCHRAGESAALRMEAAKTETWMARA